jgi:hypothetical protein
MIVVFECTSKLCSSHRAISEAMARYIIAAAKKSRSGGEFKPWAKQRYCQLWFAQTEKVLHLKEQKNHALCHGRDSLSQPSVQ